jgi:hypothetical protein
MVEMVAVAFDFNIFTISAIWLDNAVASLSDLLVAARAVLVTSSMLFGSDCRTCILMLLFEPLMIANRMNSLSVIGTNRAIIIMSVI